MLKNGRSVGLTIDPDLMDGTLHGDAVRSARCHWGFAADRRLTGKHVLTEIRLRSKGRQTERTTVEACRDLAADQPHAVDVEACGEAAVVALKHERTADGPCVREGARATCPDFGGGSMPYRCCQKGHERDGADNENSSLLAHRHHPPSLENERLSQSGRSTSRTPIAASLPIPSP